MDAEEKDRLVCGAVDMEFQDYPEANECFNRYIKCRPDNIGTAWYDRGTVFLRLKRYEQAISNFEEHISLN